MLEAHAERLVELPDNVQGRIRILYVVVRQLFASQLLGIGKGEWNLLGRSIEFCVLMRVLAIAQALPEIEFQEELLIETGLFPHPAGNHHIVLGGVGIGFCRELQTGVAAGVTTGFQFAQHHGIILGIDHDSH